MCYSINVREYRRGNQKWTIQRNWQFRVHKTKKKQNKNNVSSPTWFIIYIYLLLKSIVSNNMIIIKTKVLLPQAYMCVTLSYFVYPFYVLWFYCFRIHLSCLAFQSFDLGKHLEFGRDGERYSRTSLARTRMTRIPWIVGTVF